MIGAVFFYRWSVMRSARAWAKALNFGRVYGGIDLAKHAAGMGLARKHMRKIYFA